MQALAGNHHYRKVAIMNQATPLLALNTQDTESVFGNGTAAPEYGSGATG